MANISETTELASKFTTNFSLDSSHILNENDIITNFRSSANRINVFIYGSYFDRDFSITVQSISKRFTVLERMIQMLHFLFCNPLDIFCSSTTKTDWIGATVIYALHKWLIRFYRKLPKLKLWLHVQFLHAKIAYKNCTCNHSLRTPYADVFPEGIALSLEMTSSSISGRKQIL